MIREVRRTQNSKQDKIQVVKSQPSVNSLREGQEVIYISKSNRLERYRKEQGRLWVSYMDTDNNFIVDGTLTVDSLNVKTKLVSYKIIAHNMNDDIGTGEVFLPWFGIIEGSNLSSVSSSFLVPYSMILKKIIFRPETISTGTHDLTVRLKKHDDGDTTIDTIATAIYTSTLSSNSYIEVVRSDFDNNPKFEANKNCGISIQASGDYGGTIDWKITSVWETEILI
tara:strand:- start:3551 stop:4225 length:675 start_codon:yes stop_codon:yes gene_type:complete